MKDLEVGPASKRSIAARASAALPWSVYLIVCRNGAIYTGIARDVAARYAAHAAGTGARYTRANAPRALVGELLYPDKRAASRAEWAIKQMSASEKRQLAGVLSGPRRDRRASAKRLIAARLPAES